MISKKAILGAIFLLLAGVVAGFFWINRGKTETAKRIESKMSPEFALKDYEGREVKFSEFLGKPVLINVWASWCPYCREELQDFATLKKEFGENLVIIAINRGEPLETAKSYSEKLNIAGEIIFLLDPEDSFYKSIQGFSMPETIFADKDGFITDHRRGQILLEDMKRRTKQSFGL